MPLSRFFQRGRRQRAANALYLSMVGQARLPVFYTAFGVPDTLEGRYDMIVLHAWVLMRRLSAFGAAQAEQAKALSQDTFDLMFADMDRNLREMGVTDLGVGKRVRRMAEAFFGRVSAYDKALEQGNGALEAALARNLYQSGTPEPEYLDRMAAYVAAQLRHLDGQDEQNLLAGKLSLMPPEA